MPKFPEFRLEIKNIENIDAWEGRLDDSFKSLMRNRIKICTVFEIGTRYDRIRYSFMTGRDESGWVIGQRRIDLSLKFGISKHVHSLPFTSLHHLIKNITKNHFVIILIIS